MTIPPEIEELLTPLVEGLNAAELSPYSLAVYGPAVRSDFDIRADPINIALVFADLTSTELRKISAPVRKASRQGRVLVFLAEERELARMADCFPVKLLQIQRHHEMVKGEDPFSALSIDPVHTRLRLEQEIRNHLMRLRQAFILGGESAESLAHAIVLCTRSLWIECETLLHLLGEEPRSLAEVLLSISRRLEIHIEVFERLSKPARSREVATTFDELLSVVECLTHYVDSMETGGA